MILYNYTVMNDRGHSTTMYIRYMHMSMFCIFRFCLRMIPIKAVCYASLGEIKMCATNVLAPYFHTDPTSSIPVSKILL